MSKVKQKVLYFGDWFGTYSAILKYWCFIQMILSQIDTIFGKCKKLMDFYFDVKYLYERLWIQACQMFNLVSKHVSSMWVIHVSRGEEGGPLAVGRNVAICCHWVVSGNEGPGLEHREATKNK